MAWRRWQDWATIVLGIVAFATPFYFGIDLAGYTAWTAYIVGLVLVLSGLWTASAEKPAATFELIPVVAGLVFLAAPWLLTYTDVTGLAWTSWVVGGLAVINGLGEMLVLTGEPTAA